MDPRSAVTTEDREAAFATLQVVPRPSRAAVWALFILVAFRLAIAGWLPGDESINQGYLRRDIAAAADALASMHVGANARAGASAAEPRVVFLGSSRFNSAIVPERWAALDGLEAEQVLNLGVNRGDLWDQRYLLKRAGGLPESVSLVVLELETYMFNRNRYNSATGEPSFVQPQFLRWASLQERWTLDAPLAQRLAALGHWIWPIYLRQPASTWAIGLARGMPLRAALPAPPIYHDDPTLAARQAEDPVFTSRNMSAAHNHRLEISRTSLAHLDALIELARSAGAEVALIWPPIRAAYLDALVEDPSRARAYDRILDEVRSREAPGVRVLIWERAEDLGLDEGIFVDYGHFDRPGAEAFTEALFDALGGVPGPR